MLSTPEVLAALPALLTRILGLLAPSNPAGLGEGTCYGACYDTLASVKFDDFPPDRAPFFGRFESEHYLTSIVLCMDIYCESNATIDDSWRHMVESLVKFGFMEEENVPHVEDVRPRINYSSVEDIEVVANFGKGTVYNSTVLVSSADYAAGVDTENAWDSVARYHHAFGNWLYVLAAFIVAVGTVSRVAGHLAPCRSPRVNTGAKRTTGAVGRAYTWYRRYIETPAVGGYRHLIPAWNGWLSLPTRLEAFWISAYVAINILFCSTGYDFVAFNFHWPNDFWSEFSRYVGDRTGILCFYNIPLLWMLAGRNDIIKWCTGWSYQYSNLFHRWVARVATVQAVVHSVAYLYLTWDRLAAEWALWFYKAGVFATAAMVLLLPLSVRPFREGAYELFLNFHIFLAILTLVYLFAHVSIFRGDYDGWLWATLGLWIFDRVLRLARLLILSYKTFRSGGRNTVCKLTGGDEGLVRLTVRTSVPCSPSPGAYYFLYTPRSLTPWENHPFTLASWTRAPAGGATDLHFLLAPRGGATRRLKARIDTFGLNDLESQRGGTDTPGLDVAHEVGGGGTDMHMRVLPEGPYGASHPLHAFEHVLLIAGGSGIAAILPYVFALREHKAKRVTVVWSVRQARYAADVLRHELSDENASHARIQVWLTKESPEAAAACEEGYAAAAVGKSAPADDDTDSASSSDTLISRPSPCFDSGRPDMAGTLRTALAGLQGDERIAVLSCGPFAMMDDLRAAVARAYGEGEGRVSGRTMEYFEDAFVW